MSDHHPKISVAMCTYNGEQYLREQLATIETQTLFPCELVICDDCSTDNTVDILERFGSQSSIPVRLYKNEHNLGVIRNFSKAIELCTGDYVALSDQDDFWEINRLEKTYKAISGEEEKLGRDVPLLAYSDLKVIDEEGKLILPSLMRAHSIRHIEKKPTNRLLVQNFVTGSTCLINRSLVELSTPIPDKVMMHDWWLALIASIMGKILFIPESLVQYRQHHANVIGAKGTLRHNIEKLVKAKGVKNANKTMVRLLMQAIELRKWMGSHMNSRESIDDIDAYIHILQAGGLTAVLKIYILGTYRQGIVANLLMIYLLIKRKYVQLLQGDITRQPL